MPQVLIAVDSTQVCLEHRDIGLAHEAEKAPAYRLLSRAIKAGCRAAIAISERV